MPKRSIYNVCHVDLVFPGFTNVMDSVTAKSGIFAPGSALDDWPGCVGVVKGLSTCKGF